MREIKFRFWDTRFQRFEAAGYMFGPDGPQFPTDKIIPQQYTGLKDKNGVEIYEGDIVSCDQAQDLGFKVVGVVHYGNNYRESPGWCDPRIYLDTRPFEEYGSEFCIFHKQPEVIGNIYENPELLK